MKKIQKILVSQSQPMLAHNPYADMANKYGVQFDFRPLIHTEGLSGVEFRLQRINPLDYTAVLMTSRLAIDHYFRICEEMRLQVPESMHYYCASEAVANYLQKHIQYRKRKVFFAENNHFEDLLPAMNRRPNEKYLMVMSDIHNDHVIQMFAQKKITITPAVMYRTVSSEWPKDVAFDHDMIVLFTPAGVTSLMHNFPQLKQQDKIFACFGQNTVSALEEAGIHPDIIAPTPDCPSITTAIDTYLEAHLS